MSDDRIKASGNSSNEKRVYRLAPCPDYDLERMETWLSDMAAEGLYLHSDGFFLGFGNFYRAEPKEVRYHLSASYYPIKWLDYAQPDSEQLDMSEDLGWKYICSRGQFYIFMTEDMNAPELDSDPEVRALALNMVRKRVARSSLNLVFWAFVYPAIYHAFAFVRASIVLGTPLVIFLSALLIWDVISTFRRRRHLKKLSERLAYSGPLERVEWRDYGKKRLIGQFINLAGWLLAIVLIGARILYVYELETAVDDYTGEIPFATLTDIVEGEYEGSVWGENTVEVMSDILAPTAMLLRETAEIRKPDGEVFSGGLHVDYYETAAPWLARELAKEYRRYDWIKNRLDGGLEYVEVPGLEADLVYAYKVGSIYSTKVIIVEENKMICVYGYLDLRAMPIEDWVCVIYDSIVEE